MGFWIALTITIKLVYFTRSALLSFFPSNLLLKNKRIGRTLKALKTSQFDALRRILANIIIGLTIFTIHTRQTFESFFIINFTLKTLLTFIIFILETQRTLTFVMNYNFIISTLFTRLSLQVYNFLIATNRSF